MPRPKRKCPHCGATMVDYRQPLSKYLLRAFYLLHKAGGGPLHLPDLGLTHNQASNFQKLRYWGIVAKAKLPDGSTGGVYEITDKGRAFIRGQERIHKYAVTRRGRVIGYEGFPLLISEITGGWWLADDYNEHSTPWEGSQ